ncbi:MAG: nitroreductase family protein [Bacteroidaceae bacterium]|nr:nitroreductase family protein [Bacteroidaceae bacterium]MDY5077157.1 nitroreductase family protein [Bacteroidaceae bacterium]
MNKEPIQINIDHQRCRHCQRCVQVCPSATLRWTSERVPEMVREDHCIGCGHCVDVCEADALHHSLFPADKVHTIDRSTLPSPESLMELMRARRSNRTLTDCPVPQQITDDLLEAARYAPTSENSRKVKVIVLEKEQIRKLEDTVMRFLLRLASVLMSKPMRPLTKMLLPNLYAEAPELERFRLRWEAGEMPCCCNASSVLVFSAPSGYDFAWQDCNLAYQNVSLMAEAHGISQIYLGLIQITLQFMPRGKVRRLLGLPKGHVPRAFMAIGIPRFKYARYTER